MVLVLAGELLDVRSRSVLVLTLHALQNTLSLLFNGVSLVHVLVLLSCLQDASDLSHWHL